MKAQPLRYQAGGLPERVDLRAFCSPIEDQGQVGSCAANAVVGAMEYHMRRAEAPMTDLSRLFVYYNARALANKEGEDCGTYIHHVMASVLAHGAWNGAWAWKKIRPLLAGAGHEFFTPTMTGLGERQHLAEPHGLAVHGETAQ